MMTIDTTLENLKAAQAAAFAAWKACPEKSRAEKAKLAAELDAAAKAVAAAKRALEPAPVIDLETSIASWKARHDAMEAEVAEFNRLRPVGVWNSLTQAWDVSPSRNYSRVARAWEFDEQASSSAPAVLDEHGGPSSMNRAEREAFYMSCEEVA